MDRIDLVGVGSLFAIERDGGIAPGGIAADAPRLALARGASGIPVGRVGMDRFGTAITEALKADGFDVSSVQVDSDLATARRVQRGATVRLEPYAAFDNLQFDSDVENLARNAEAIVTDACSRRHGQARQAIDRMLVAAPNAVRIVDLVRRAPLGAGEDRLDRESLGNAIELCQIFIVDRIALRTVMPAAADPIDAARRFASQTRATLVTVLADAGATCVTGSSTDEFPGWTADRSCEAAVTIALALVHGHDMRRALGGG